MPGRSSLVVLMVASLPWSAPARAAEAYLCGPDTIVYVKADELEFKKRTDACIASHYGLTVDAAQPAAGKPSPVKSAAAKTSPVKSVAEKAPTAPSANLRPLADADIVLARSRAPTRLAAATAPDTDFRNVRVLNPTSPDGVWFRHDK